MEIIFKQTWQHCTEKNGLVGLNNNFNGKWTSQNFLVKSTKILVEITRILIGIIILIKIRILMDFRMDQKYCINQNSDYLN